MENARRDVRTPVTLKIKFKSENLDQFIERYSVDVSRGGIFIRTKTPVPVGTQVKFEFQLQDSSPLISGEGTVVWIREYDPNRTGVAPGMGVRFDKLAPHCQEVLDRILAEKARTFQTADSSFETAAPRGSKPVVSSESVGGQVSGAIEGKKAVPQQLRLGSILERTPLPQPMPFGGEPTGAGETDEFGATESTRVMSPERAAQLLEETRGEGEGEGLTVLTEEGVASPPEEVGAHVSEEGERAPERDMGARLEAIPGSPPEEEVKEVPGGPTAPLLEGEGISSEPGAPPSEPALSEPALSSVPRSVPLGGEPEEVAEAPKEFREPTPVSVSEKTPASAEEETPSERRAVEDVARRDRWFESEAQVKEGEAQPPKAKEPEGKPEEAVSSPVFRAPIPATATKGPPWAIIGLVIVAGATALYFAMAGGGRPYSGGEEAVVLRKPTPQRQPSPPPQEKVPQEVPSPMRGEAVSLLRDGGGQALEVPPKATEGVPRGGEITVESEPPGGKVFVDGREYPRPTPTPVGNLKPGSSVEVRVVLPGYKEATKKVTVPAEAPGPPVKLSLVPLPGTLVIESTPPGATVRLNGKRLPKPTPVTVPNVDTLKEHVVELVLKDHAPFTVHVKPSDPWIPEEKTRRFVVQASLAPISKPEPTPQAGLRGGQPTGVRPKPAKPEQAGPAAKPVSPPRPEVPGEPESPVAKPEPEKAKPEPEKAKPEPEKAKPEPEKAKPEPEKAKPEPEKAKPEPEPKKPDTKGEEKKPEESPKQPKIKKPDWMKRESESGGGER